jgi:hypothetical protein
VDKRRRNFMSMDTKKKIDINCGLEGKNFNKNGSTFVLFAQEQKLAAHK